MMRNLVFFGIILCGIIGWLQAALAQDKGSVNQEIIIVESNWPPYSFGEEPSSLPGFLKEILSQCVPEAGYRPSFQFYPVQRMYSYIETGEVDVVVFSPNKEREHLVEYGHKPLFASSYRPVVRADSGIKITSLADFDNLRLGHLGGLKYSPQFLEYVNKRHAANTLVTTTFGGGLTRMLLEGVIDVYVDTKDTVVWRAQQEGTLGKIKILDFDIKTAEYFVTVVKKSPRISSPRTFLKNVDQCIQRLKNNGMYYDISHKYGIQ